MKIDFYKTFNSKDAQEITFEQLTDIIRGDEELKRTTALYRDLLAQGLGDASKKVKESTPQVAVSFRMEGGKGKDCCRECLYQVLIDFDAKTDGERLPQEELERVKTILRTSYRARLAYESLSGLGYHIIVPFKLSDGITIDMDADPRQGEEIFTRAYRTIAQQYTVWCGHKMDMECKNINRMTGLSHDPIAVYRPDARPFVLTREELGIDKDGHLIKMKTPNRALDKDGNRVSVPLGDHLERAVKMVEEADMAFAPGNRHNFVMRVCFILNRMGVDEDEAAKALDDEYLGKMDGKPSDILHSCYKTASREFGVWMPQRSAVKTEIVADFLKKKELQYDVLSQKTRRKQDNGQWQELKERHENDLFMECCAESGTNITEKLFHTVLNSSVVPEVNPLRDYVMSRAAWRPDMPDYIGQVARMVHMATNAENDLWHVCFRKWFVAMVAGWTDEAVVNHQVIVLIGCQGIYKSSWINRLLPPDLVAYTTDHIDIERLDKDEELRAAEYGLINIDELDRLTDRQLNKLKQMITTTNVDVRAPFGRHKKKRVRVASYAASGNKQEFLTDQTGNRRWLPFHVVTIDSPYKHALPYDGMYAQALYLLENGFNYWFENSETDALEEHVGEFMIPTSEEELIPIYYSPAKMDDAGSKFLTLSEIAAKIMAYGNLKKNPERRRLGAIMTKLGFVKERKGHDKRTGYYVREHTQSEIEQMHQPDIF
jgi:predicted P-loop ATPase